MEEVKACENCKHWIEIGGTDAGLVGECHKNSPIPAITADASAETAMWFAKWPSTSQTQWCGDYEERPMDTKEVIARMAAIEKMEADRKAKMKAS